MKKSTHKRLTAWLLTLALVVTLLPGMGMTALAVEDGGEGNGPPAVEVVAPEDESSGSDETVGTPPSTEPESKEEDKNTKDEGDPSGSDYGIGDDTQPRRSMRAPVMPTAAEYQNVKVNSVTLSNGQYLASNSATTAINSSKEPSSYVAWYKDGVLTLNGYDGNYIQVSGASKSDLTVKLKGSNTITSSYRAGIIQNGKGGSITVTADSSSDKLTIDVTYSRSVAGIDNGTIANDILGDVTITGYADVTIRARTTGNSSDQGYGIYAKNASILDNASVNITCETPNRTSGYLCNGIYAQEAASINTDGKIKIDVKTNAGTGDAHSYGINVVNRSLTLTKAAEMVVEWRNGPDASTAGAPYTPKTASFNTGTHAINVDTTNCYASYRFGTPRTVTVNNGKFTGPGVMYAKEGSGKFLVGDKVDLTAPPRQISATDSTHIPFDKWTSANVGITNPTSPSGAYIMVPYTDTTVQAHYKAFTVQPSFTKINSIKGTVSVTLISTGLQNGPYLCPANNLESEIGGFMPVAGTTTYEKAVYESSTPSGEYVVKVKYNKVTYYSEPFMIDYSERAANIDPVTISGETDQPIKSTDVTVTLQDCTFNNPLGSTGGWITNLPAGLSQSVTRVSNTEAKITVSSTPTANCVKPIEVTVPTTALSDGISPLTAPSSENAKFKIETTLTAAAATIQHPVAGQHPDMNPVSADSSKYTVKLDKWSDVTETDTFEAGKWYECNLIFTPQPGYAFASDSDMAYTINGKSAKVLFPWVYLSMEALPSAISLDVSETVDLGNTKPHETVPVKNIKVSNHLSSEISNIPIALSDPTNFRVFPQSITSIPANGTGTFQVAPAPNLSLGEYSTKVTVGDGSSGIIEQSFTVEFSVREVIMLTANTPTYNGEWQTGVTASEADVIIEGNSRRDAGNYTATAYLKSGYYMWPDYTTAYSKQIQWSIRKRDPKIEDFDVTLPDERSEWEIEFGPEGPYATYDGTAKTATAKLKTKYSGCGDITVKYKKFVSGGTYETLDAAIDAGTYTVLVCVAPGGKNFNAASVEYTYQDFIIKKAPLTAPKLTVEAPTTPGGKGKIVGTTTQMRYAPVSGGASTCSDGATEVYPGKYWVQLMAASSDTNHDDSGYTYVTVPEYGAGVTVSGTIKSYGSASEAVTVTLLQGTSVIGSPQVLTGAFGSAPYSQNYSFPAVPAGTYTLKVMKKGHAPWTEEITVDSTAIAKDVTIYLYGDINGDGFVKANDKTVLARYLANWPGYETLPVYPAVADLNGDGFIKANDKTVLARYLANWPGYETLPIT